MDENFGGMIEDVNYSEFEFGGEGKVLEGFEREMVIFKMEMQEWMRELESKKEQIKKMPKKKWL